MPQTNFPHPEERRGEAGARLEGRTVLLPQRIAGRKREL
jgi:hypothetical protein